VFCRHEIVYLTKRRRHALSEILRLLFFYPKTEALFFRNVGMHRPDCVASRVIFIVTVAGTSMPAETNVCWSRSVKWGEEGEPLHCSVAIDCVVRGVAWRGVAAPYVTAWRQRLHSVGVAGRASHSWTVRDMRTGVTTLQASRYNP
jgi:hypothetical protein